MKLIVGLGNPGKEYSGNRHNIGYRCINKLAKMQGIDMKQHGSRAQFGVGEINDCKIALAKPRTFMNLSGEAVKLLGKRFEVLPEDIWVIHDDLDLPLGKIRISRGGGSGGHKGVDSIINELENRDFTRIRIGIDHPPEDCRDTAEYVLGDFGYDEKAVVEDAISRVVEAVLDLVQDGIVAAMNKYN